MQINITVGTIFIPVFNGSTQPDVLLLYSKWTLYSLQRKKWTGWRCIFLFQRATEGTERAAYKKLIAPYKDDMPKSDLEGLKTACARHKYAYIGTNFLRLQLSSVLTCQLVPLPGTSYPETLTYIISLNNPYKGLINWRWVGQGKLRIRFPLDSALLKGQRNDSLLWVRGEKSKAYLYFKKTGNFNSRSFQKVFTNIGTLVKPWATIRHSVLAIVFNRHYECNVFGNIWVKEILAKIR